VVAHVTGVVDHVTGTVDHVTDEGAHVNVVKGHAIAEGRKREDRRDHERDSHRETDRVVEGLREQEKAGTRTEMNHRKQTYLLLTACRSATAFDNNAREAEVYEHLDQKTRK